MENGISRLYPARIMGHMALEQATVLMVVLVTESRAIAQAFPSLKFVIPILHLMKVHDNICKFAKNGLVPSEIGVILRDSHGIAQVNSLTGSKILRILKSHGLATEMPEDLYHLIKKAVAIRKLYNVFTAVRAFRIVSPSESLLR
uniref:40S ribosomal protein S13 n=1 Tax=Tanacetum cinerariifolium TaxID=118510 RepID=A0A6L2M358_TANCI|nr:40S ribosomal protein S13 [Tanacetum cinerariifolium]